MSKSDQSSETVSALMDGEVTDFELRRILERLDEDPLLAAKWRRYHLVRSALHSEQVGEPELDISSAVSAAIADEPVFDEVEEIAAASDVSGGASVISRRGRAWRSLASMAMAASVTAVAIFGIQNFNLSQSDNSAQFADLRPSYQLPALADDSLYQRARFGDLQSGQDANFSQPDVIRLSQGLSRYIDQHRHMMDSEAPQWQTEWVPEGFQTVRHEVLPGGEVMVFSNGRHSFSVSVEPFGRDSASEGAVQSGDLIALGVRSGDQFVTVVGDIPLMLADRIASSVRTRL